MARYFRTGDEAIIKLRCRVKVIDWEDNKYRVTYLGLLDGEREGSTLIIPRHRLNKSKWVREDGVWAVWVRRIGAYPRIGKEAKAKLKLYVCKRGRWYDINGDWPELPIDLREYELFAPVRLLPVLEDVETVD